MRENSVAYGIDLAGYSSTGKSQVARVIRTDDANGCYLAASLIPTNLLRGYSGTEPLKKVIDSDIQVFSDLLGNGGICAVDVPIDLQGLDSFNENKTYLWEVTKRPIDYKLGALPPLADKIGAVVARMQLIIKNFPGLLGVSIFETYPAASLKLLSLNQQYKGGNAIWQNGKWVPSTMGAKNNANIGLSNMLNQLNVVSYIEGLNINDDQIDAILSAVPLLSRPWLMESDLINHPSLADKKLLKAPNGYILCGDKFWSRIEIH